MLAVMSQGRGDLLAGGRSDAGMCGPAGVTLRDDALGGRQPSQSNEPPIEHLRRAWTERSSKAHVSWPP
jgi:hypothetical protein